MIKHHFGRATRSWHAMNLTYRAVGIRCVMQNSVRIHNVKAVITKRQSFAVGNQEDTAGAIECKPVTRYLYRPGRQVKSYAARATPSKLQKVGAVWAPTFCNFAP